MILQCSDSYSISDFVQKSKKSTGCKGILLYVCDAMWYNRKRRFCLSAHRESYVLGDMKPREPGAGNIPI